MLLLDQCTAESAGELLLLCLLIRHADEPATAALVPRVLALAWETRIGHVQIEALDTASHVRSAADAETTEAIIEVLDGLHSEDLLVSTTLVDTLYIYDQIESPYSSEMISTDIAEVLAHPEAPEVYERAMGLVCGQFEDVVAAPFLSAVEALSEHDRIRLNTLAVQAEHTNFFTRILLDDLLSAGDPTALPAFLRWAGRLDIRSPFVQEEIGCHLRGILGCAAHTDTPPALLTSHSGSDAEAWRGYGEIIFWLNRPGLTPEERTDLCAPLLNRLNTELVDAAVDPLQTFYWASYSYSNPGESPLLQILHAYPAETRRILTYGLTHRDRATSLMPYPISALSNDPLIALLALVGDQSTIALLEPLREDRTFGWSAVHAVRNLKARLNG